MTGIEDELRDADSMMRQPDEGLTIERRGADEIARLKILLIESLEAMSEATRRYRTSGGLPGNSTEVPGWVEWLDRMQMKIGAELNREVRR